MILLRSALNAAAVFFRYGKPKNAFGVYSHKKSPGKGNAFSGDCFHGFMSAFTP